MYKFYAVKIENGYRLVREENDCFFVPFCGIATKYKMIDRKTLKGISNWCNKKGIKFEGVISE